MNTLKSTFIFCLLALTHCAFTQVKIGDNIGTVNAASLLELESTTKGLLLPRLTTSQIKAMTNVPKGMLVFNSTDSALFIKRDTGWAVLALASGSNSIDNKWGANGANIYNVNPGNVGIGTPNPIAALHVQSVGSNVLIGKWEGGPGSSAISMNGSLSSANYNFRSSGNDGTLNINRPPSGSILFTRANVTQMTLLPSGNLGIGTSTPTQKLEVVGDIAYSGNLHIGVQHIFRQADIPATGTSQYFVGCPLGTAVIGGGGGHRDYNLAAKDVTVNFSGPDPPTNSWRIVMSNDNLFYSRAVIYYVICAKVR